MGVHVCRGRHAVLWELGGVPRGGAVRFEGRRACCAVLRGTRGGGLFRVCVCGDGASV